MEDLENAAARLLRELNTGSVAWVGLLMGEMVGPELALRRPAPVFALVLTNTASSYQNVGAPCRSSASLRYANRASRRIPTRSRCATR